jgi:hypothetical protein
MIVSESLLEPETSINISELANGIYIIKLFNQNTILSTSKIIKQ